MALPAAKVKSDTVIDRLRLTQGEFDWDNRGASGDLSGRVDLGIAKAQIRILQRIGTATYASVDAVTAAAIAQAEEDLACHNMLRERYLMLSSRPEEAPPPEYIDLDALRAEIQALDEEWQELLAPYLLAEDFDKPGTGFSFKSRGVDETEADVDESDYDEMDFDDLPSG